MYYIRKFDNSPWHHYNYNETGKISSDAVTKSLQTTSRTLSLWRTDTLTSIEEKGLLALFGSMDSIDKIDVLIFEENELIDAGMTLKNNPGKTSIASLSSLHTDIIELDLDLLNSFAHLFAKKLMEEELKKTELQSQLKEAKRQGQDQEEIQKKIDNLFLRRYTLPSIKKIMLAGNEKGIFEISDLPERSSKKLLN